MSSFFEQAEQQAEEEAVAEVLTWPPGTTDAERKRFVDARKGDEAAAIAMLEAHLQWRTSVLPLGPDQPAVGAGIPNLLRFTDAKARDGSRVVLLMAAMIDLDLASSEEYTLALAAVFDAEFDRESAEKVTVLVDVRGGEGWRNPSAPSLVPFIRGAANVLSTNFPERMRRLVVVPLPWVAFALWAVVRQFLDPVTAEKVVVLNGPADRQAPLPESLSEHLEDEALRIVEGCRKAELRPSKEVSA